MFFFSSHLPLVLILLGLIVSHRSESRLQFSTPARPPDAQRCCTPRSPETSSRLLAASLCPGYLSLDMFQRNPRVLPRLPPRLFGCLRGPSWRTTHAVSTCWEVTGSCRRIPTCLPAQQGSRDDFADQLLLLALSDLETAELPGHVVICCSSLLCLDVFGIMMYRSSMKSG